MLMEMNDYFSRLKNIHQNLINFLEDMNETDECFKELVKYFDNQKRVENKSDLKELLIMISKISKYHHFNELFKKKIQITYFQIMKSFLYFQSHIFKL